MSLCVDLGLNGHESLSGQFNHSRYLPKIMVNFSNFCIVKFFRTFGNISDSGFSMKIGRKYCQKHSQSYQQIPYH